jgi:hypothetical protein
MSEALRPLSEKFSPHTWKLGLCVASASEVDVGAAAKSCSSFGQPQAPHDWWFGIASELNPPSDPVGFSYELLSERSAFGSSQRQLDVVGRQQ